jgi:hypothetical protein
LSFAASASTTGAQIFGAGQDLALLASKIAPERTSCSNGIWSNCEPWRTRSSSVMGFCSSEAPRKILLGGRIKEPFDLGIFQ